MEELTKWEYTVYPVDPKRMKVSPEGGHIQEGMNAHGQDGWELVAVTLQPDGWHHLFYKRPVVRKRGEAGMRLLGKPDEDD